jgi:hypothetical protein
MSATRMCGYVCGYAMVLAISTAAVAAPFDGTLPLDCEALRGHDCLITGTECRPLLPGTAVKAVFGIDFEHRVVHSPYRTALLRIVSLTENEESLVLQGADLQFAWNALIKKKTGELTISVSDRDGAYVVFGQCAWKKKTDK